LVTIFINTSDIAPSSPYNFRKISISTTTTITNRLAASPALHLHHHLKKSIAHHQYINITTADPWKNHFTINTADPQ
jgi:hypothetical protein